MNPFGIAFGVSNSYLIKFEINRRLIKLCIDITLFCNDEINILEKTNKCNQTYKPITTKTKIQLTPKQNLWFSFATYILNNFDLSKQK